MRILFLSHYFPPEVNAPASRTFEHCRQWVKDGHQVTVITCVPNHPRGKVYPGYRNRFYSSEEIDGIRVVRVWTYVTANEGFLKRTANYVSYMVSASIAAPFVGASDIVISTSPQFFNGLAGYLVSRTRRIPWVLEIRDLWPESILAVGAIKNRAIIRFLEYLEKFAYRKADRIVPVTDAFRKYMIDLGIDSGKIEVIKNGVDLGFYQVHEPDRALQRELDIEGKFIASYFGTHGMAHHLETILEAADLLRENKDIVFLIVGDGAERRSILEMRDSMSLGNVIMLEQQAKDRMPALWAISDASLVLLKRMDLFKTVIPSKIFESMAMRKPVVLGVEGESRELLEQANAGCAIEPENARQLADAVLELARDPGLCRSLGDNGREYVALHYDRVRLAQRFESLLSSVMDENKL